MSPNQRTTSRNVRLSIRDLLDPSVDPSACLRPQGEGGGGYESEEVERARASPQSDFPTEGSEGGQVATGRGPGGLPAWTENLKIRHKSIKSAETLIRVVGP